MPLTIDDILQAYKAHELSFTTARNELVHEYCLSVGNATEMLYDQRS